MLWVSVPFIGVLSFAKLISGDCFDCFEGFGIGLSLSPFHPLSLFIYPSIDLSIYIKKGTKYFVIAKLPASDKTRQEIPLEIHLPFPVTCTYLLQWHYRTPMHDDPRNPKQRGRAWRYSDVTKTDYLRDDTTMVCKSCKRPLNSTNCHGKTNLMTSPRRGVPYAPLPRSCTRHEVHRLEVYEATFVPCVDILHSTVWYKVWNWL